MSGNWFVLSVWCKCIEGNTGYSRVSFYDKNADLSDFHIPCFLVTETKRSPRQLILYAPTESKAAKLTVFDLASVIKAMIQHPSH